MDFTQVSIYATYFIGGALGGLTRSVVLNKGIIVFGKKWHDDNSGKTGIDLGILASMFIGGIVGMITDQNFITAMSFGISGSYIIEELMKKELPK